MYEVQLEWNIVQLHWNVDSPDEMGLISHPLRPRPSPPHAPIPCPQCYA
jgi:hypothetical protein